jgi:hypothetical protein
MNPREAFYAVSARTSKLEWAILAGDDAATLSHLALLRDDYANLAAEAVLQAVRQGMTQRRASILLGVSEAAIRGARREASRVDA